VTAGYDHSAGLKADGTIVAWGRNEHGQCNIAAPNQGYIAVEAGAQHTLGLRDDGSVAAWGRNDSGQCNVTVPNVDFVDIAGGSWHSLGLKSFGSIVVWGSNLYSLRTVPSPNEGFVELAGGEYHCLGVKGFTSIEDGSFAGLNPAVLSITGIYPSPVRSTATVAYSSPGISSLKLEVFDITGRLVDTEELGESPEGEHLIMWDGRGSSASGLASGVYILSISGLDQQASARMVLLR
jgi:hypothetical protein